jgi:hypothetical protein
LKIGFRLESFLPGLEAQPNAGNQGPANGKFVEAGCAIRLLSKCDGVEWRTQGALKPKGTRVFRPDFAIAGPLTSLT